MTNTNISTDHPALAVRRITERVHNGEVQLLNTNKQVVEQFLALKLALPTLSDEAAASLLISGCLTRGIDVETFNVN